MSATAAPPPLANHIVQFFEDGHYAADRIAAFLGEALASGHPAVAIATQVHLELISAALLDQGIDPALHARAGVLVRLDARETLARFMGPVLPDAERCQDTILGILAPLEARSKSIRVYGEMVDVLAMDGRADAALRLEELWNGFLERGSFRLLCGYALSRFHTEDGGRSFDGVCEGHVEVRPAAAEVVPLPADHDRIVAELQFKNGALQAEIARRREIERERERLYDEARSAGEALREANRRKDEFLAVLGHELRNPLSPIMTALQLMKLRGDAGCEKERAVIERQVLHMNRLVDDLLDVSRITQGKLQMKKQRVELASVVARAIELASPLIESRAHRLSVEVPQKGILVEVDEVRFAQAVANLLTNAAKYTDREGQIVVRCVREGGAARITVSDSGIGLRPEALATIFEPFVQVQRTLERSQGGLGLGLALVKSLVQLHGGEVHAASDGPGTGSRFSITIPAVAGGEAFTEPARARLAAATVVRRALIVDDNCDAADGLAELLRVLGHDVAVAYDASAALEMAEAASFDVAILDLSLPVVDGYELARRLREKTKSPSLRLIALTGYGTEEDRVRTTAAGFEAHFVKPVDHDRLLRLLATRPPGEVTH